MVLTLDQIGKFVDEIDPNEIESVIELLHQKKADSVYEEGLDEEYAQLSACGNYDELNECIVFNEKNPKCETCEEFTANAPCARGEWLIQKRKELVVVECIVTGHTHNCYIGDPVYWKEGILDKHYKIK